MMMIKCDDGLKMQLVFEFECIVVVVVVDVVAMSYLLWMYFWP